MKIKVNRFDHGWDVPLPKRAHYNDAGADVYTAEPCKIAPHETAKVPLGFGVEVPDGYMACIYPRSGLSCMGIVCELPPIDSGYRGEVHAIVTNCSDSGVSFERGTRIGQIVVTPVVLADFAEELGEVRGAAGYGSTGLS